MARKRMIDPNFWQSEDISKLSYFARLVFIGLFSNADDEGRGRAKAAYLKSMIFPYDEDIEIVKKVDEALDEIAKSVSIIFYKIDDSEYFQLTKWKNWQNVERPTKSKIPAYFEGCEITRRGVSQGQTDNERTLTDKSPNNHRTIGEQSPPNIKEENIKEVNIKEEKVVENACAREDDFTATTATSYGIYQNVLLEDFEYVSLKEMMGKDDLADYINRLSGWIQNGKFCNTPAATISKWWNEDRAKRESKEKHKTKSFADDLAEILSERGEL